MTDDAEKKLEFPIKLGFCQITAQKGRENRQYYDVEFTPPLPSITHLKEDGYWGENHQNEQGTILTTNLYFSKGSKEIKNLRTWLVKEKHIKCDPLNEHSEMLAIDADIATVASLLSERKLLSDAEKPLVETLHQLHRQRDKSSFIAAPTPIQSSLMVAMLAEENRPSEPAENMRGIEKHRQSRLNLPKGPDSGPPKRF